MLFCIVITSAVTAKMDTAAEIRKVLRDKCIYTIWN